MSSSNSCCQVGDLGYHDVLVEQPDGTRANERSWFNALTGLPVAAPDPATLTPCVEPAKVVAYSSGTLCIV